MLSDLESYRAVQATISRYGDGAGLHATQRADEPLAAGDMEGGGGCCRMMGSTFSSIQKRLGRLAPLGAFACQQLH